MATALQWDMEPEATRGANRPESAKNTWRDRTEAYKLRMVPNEDVYFYSKRINNSRLVKPVDPVSRRKAWGVMAGGMSFAGLLILLMLPHLMNLMAGMQIHRLEEERRALLTEHDAIALEEAKLMDPERMKAIAKKNSLVELSPDQVHYLRPADNRVYEAQLQKQ
jgi:hypothetical protein